MSVPVVEWRWIPKPAVQRRGRSQHNRITERRVFLCAPVVYLKEASRQ
jgi:hypothetical protein